MLRRPLEPKQYTAIRLAQRLTDAGIQPSMGSVGDSYDNALAENFFSILKIERVYRRAYRTREEAELVDFPQGAGHLGYAAMVDGSGVRCRSHSTGGR